MALSVQLRINFARRFCCVEKSDKVKRKFNITRRAAALFLALFILATLSCGPSDRTVDCYAMLEQVCRRNTVAYAKKYCFFAGENDYKRLDEETSLALYGYDLYDYCSDFAVAICRGAKISEIHILLAKDEGAADALLLSLEKRSELIRSRELYWFDAQDALLVGASIYVKGNFLCLAATDNPNIVIECIKKIID